ncbi:porin [Paraburkholderia sp. CNPSo 3274]|uniref:porin n=1 Tax=Paraburkholderia sp. CNPSo 3274 TaxID=2940932 RepID=UPI0020B66F5F|nr:porin [Paraburkholderia sp. CNPSo 3274]MCP3707156.1 porin [Paraburkholderia sp. CNPSo 3274]
MKKVAISSSVGALFAVAATSAFAQSSVTLYGLVDNAIRYQTNAGVGGKDQVSMTSGPETHSRWGLKGSEDLGDGLSAVFRLENGFEAFNGQLHENNTLFSRQAYVGLSSNKWGALTFGRQYAPAYDTLGDVFDPLTVGDYWQNSWMYNGIGNYLTVNNSVKYKGTFDNLSIDALYGFGNQAGSVGLGATYAVELTYAYGPAQLNVGFHQVSVPTSATGSSVGNNIGSAINGGKTTFYHVSGAYQLNQDIRLLAGWLHGQDQTGLTDYNMQQAGAPTLHGFSRNRIDDTYYVGANWQATAPLLFTFAYYYGQTRNALLLDGSLGRGINQSATVLGEYSFSKHTEVYGIADWARGTGAFSADYPGGVDANNNATNNIGRTNQLGLAIGLRKMF